MRFCWLAFVLLCDACGNLSTYKDSSADDSATVSEDSAVAFEAQKPDSTLAVDKDPCLYQQITDPRTCEHFLGEGTKYDLSLGVDAGTCDGRPTVPCSGTCGAGVALYSQMMDLIGGCGFVPSENSVGVTFSQGCAEHLSMWLPGPDSDAIATCIFRALSASKFACAEQVPCWGVEFSTLAFHLSPATGP